jgi:Predicted AAA-ATPase/PD-(D/E)XK nuclease superfamily
MLKIPYGQSDFKKVILDGYFYQDRTEFIRILETAPTFLYYLRPRRFGKSLFVSMLHHYYGVEHQPQFKQLFGQLAIGKKPTPLANKYLILSFEFSGIQTNTAAHTFNDFLENIRESVGIFLNQYDDIFPPDIHASIIEKKQPNGILKTLFSHYIKISKTKKIPKIYLLVDEYDHFANELISFNFDYFAKSVTENGFVRKFYETIKTATRDGVVDRLFITGVSPVTLDSMTSGFNIGVNVSLIDKFHGMMGFEEAEVRSILRDIGIKNTELTEVLDDLRAWYDGYLFNIEAKAHIYNTDMVLYFATQYQLGNKYPDNLLDPNIATDYGKIRKIFTIQGRETENLDVLNKLTEDGQVSAELTIQFSLERNFSKDDLISLLFYMGFLTIKEQDIAGFIFRFPNYVIERLYADYFVSMLKEQKGLPIDNRLLNAALRDIAKFGNPELLYNEVIKVVKALSTRDSQGFNENSLKSIFVSLLQQQQFYYVHSEYESDRQYVDVFLETIRGHAVKFEAAFELKYIKKAEKINLEKELNNAEIQLKHYMISNKFIERPNLKAFVVLVHGTELHTRPISLEN